MMVSLAEILHRSEICWHGVNPYSPDWDHKFTLFGDDRYIPGCERLRSILFSMPIGHPCNLICLCAQNINGNWHRIVDTALPSPLDIIPLGNPLPEIQGHYLVAPRSACLFVCGGFATEPLTVGGGINSVVEPRR